MSSILVIGSNSQVSREIGEILSISEKTVEFHLSNTIRKLGVSNRITAVVKALQLGLIKL